MIERERETDTDTDRSDRAQIRSTRTDKKSIDKFDALWHCLVPHISPKTFFNFHTIAPFAASSHRAGAGVGTAGAGVCVCVRIGGRGPTQIC